MQNLLSDRHNHRLMVSSCGESADTVDTSWETASDGGLQVALSITGIIDTLEESEGLRVEWSCGVEGIAHILKRDMDVTNDRTTTVELLRSRVVLSSGVDECAGLQVCDSECDIEIGVWLDINTSLGVGDDSRHHVGLGWDITHNDTIAGSIGVLDTIGDSLAGTEVDEVIWVAGNRGQ